MSPETPSHTGYDPALSTQKKADIFQSAFCFIVCNAVAIFYPALFWFIPLYPVYLAGWGGFFLKGFSWATLTHVGEQQGNVVLAFGSQFIVLPRSIFADDNERHSVVAQITAWQRAAQQPKAA